MTSELNAKKCTTTTPRRDICRNFLTDVVFRLLSQGVVRRPRHYPALNGGIASFSMPSFYIAKYTTGPQGGVYIWNCTMMEAGGRGRASLSWNISQRAERVRCGLAAAAAAAQCISRARVIRSWEAHCMHNLAQAATGGGSGQF